MDNPYVHGLKQYDNRPRSPVVVPHDMSALRKKILFENTLLEERALHEFSAGKGDGAGVDTGSAPLAPTSAPAPAGIVAATAGNLIISFAYPDAPVPPPPIFLEYTKLSNTQWYFDFEDGNDGQLTWNRNDPPIPFWALYLNYNGTKATNPSTNPLIIPTTGWTYTTGSGPSISITAA